MDLFVDQDGDMTVYLEPTTDNKNGLSGKFEGKKTGLKLLFVMIS